MTRRVRLHARVAQALEALYGEDVESHAAELAHHFAQAEAELGTEKLVRYSLVAGEQALVAYAWEECQAHFERGIAAKDLTPDRTEAATDEEAAALLFGLGRAQLATAPRQEMAKAVTKLRRAFDYGPWSRRPPAPRCVGKGRILI